MTKEQTLLLQRIDEVLHYIWDPIGVCHVPAARDEYASYADQVFSMLIKDAGTDVIAAYLTQISSDQMGLLNNDETIENDKAVADILVEWKEILLGP